MAKHIDQAERRAIERALKSGKSLRTIAKERKRSVSSISEEVRHRSVRGVYRAERAQKKADARRKASKQKCLKVAMDSTLKAYVTKEITQNQSPEAVSGRLRTVDTHLHYASPKAIYHFVHSPHGGPLEHHLYRVRVTRKGGPKRGTKRASDTTKRMITERPEHIQEREEFGHFEGDFIVSGKNGHGALLVLVERRTRRVFLARADDRRTEATNTLIGTTLRSVPVKSLTLDNDISFAKHEALSDLVHADVYFTRPYTSPDKGTVENRNGRIREFVKKGTDISAVSDATLECAEHHLNTRYMKCLGWKTPQEAWDAEIEKWRAQEANAIVQKNA